MTYISSLVNLCNKALSGLNNFKSQFIAFTLPRILILAVFIAGFYMFSAGLNALMLVMLIGFILNLVLIFAYLKKAGIIFSLNYFRLNNISAILKFSLPLGFTVIFNFLYDKIDVLLISIIRDYTEVAFYNVGYGLFKAAMLSFSFLLVSGFTEVSAISSDKPRVKLFFKQYAKIIIVICVIMSVLLFFLSDFITNLLYTEKFQSSAIVVRILSLGIIAVGLNNLTGIVINGMGYFKVVMYITLYGLVLNLVLNAVFIPRYGIIAASVVTLITEYFVFLTEYFYLKKILK
jgi:O-antigen/teichoic acid export membrane protein